MEPKIFMTIPGGLMFFLIGRLILKAVKHNYKSGRLLMGNSATRNVRYIYRDENPIVFHFANSLLCVAVCMMFFVVLLCLFLLFSELLGWLSDWLRIKELAD